MSAAGARDDADAAPRDGAVAAAVAGGDDVVVVAMYNV